MDGYALRLADAAPGEFALPLSAAVPAGTGASELQPGTAAAVMTGAPIPAGADLVVPVEKTLEGFAPLQQLEGTSSGQALRTARITFTAIAPEDLVPGKFIRFAGSDVAQGAVLAEHSQQLTPALLAVLAACGFAAVPVFSPVRALILSTGAEVREPGEPLGPGELYDANSVLIRSVLEEAGHQVHSGRIGTDDPQRFTQAFDELLARVKPQLIITAGGISAGAYDVVRQVLSPRGISFGSVAQQPGGPQGWGLLEIPDSDGPVPAAVIALPGNPVSCMVSLEVLLRPALRQSDTACPPPRRVLVQLAEPVTSPPGLRQFRRVSLRREEGELAARLIGGPSSHLLGHLARADALLELAEDDTSLTAGQQRTALLLPGRTAPDDPALNAPVPEDRPTEGEK